MIYRSVAMMELLIFMSTLFYRSANTLHSILTVLISRFSQIRFRIGRCEAIGAGSRRGIPPKASRVYHRTQATSDQRVGATFDTVRASKRCWRSSFVLFFSIVMNQMQCHLARRVEQGSALLREWSKLWNRQVDSHFRVALFLPANSPITTAK